MASKKSNKTAAKVTEFGLGNVSKEWTELPSGEFGDTFPAENTKPGTVLEGAIVDYRTNVGKNEQDLFVVRTAKGDNTVWSAAGLSRLFALGKDAIGLLVRIQFDGTKKIPGKRQPMKLFKVAVRKK